MSLSKGYTKDDHALATRMSRIRTKIKNHNTVSQRDRALLADYDLKKAGRGRPRTTEPVEKTQPPEPALASESAPQVHTELPGMGAGEFVPPPLDVSGVGVPPATSSSSGPASGGHTASGATTSGSAPPPKGPAPAMSREEAEATGNMVAGMVVNVMKEFNSYNIDHGASGFAKEGEYWALLHFSVKRLTIKYGSVIDEDTYDSCVIAGSAGFIGWNSYKVYRHERHAAVAPHPVEEKAASNGANGNGQGHPDTPTSGSFKPRTGPLAPRREFNADGPF
jgi:hypothetical protein